MEGHHSLDFGTSILKSLDTELKGSKDFAKLCSGLSILGYVASFPEPINSQALSQLLFFLAHRYPKIRKAAADQLYLVFLQNNNLVSEDQMKRAIEVISETSWEGAIEDAKVGRSQLYEIVGIKEKVVHNSSNMTIKKNAHKNLVTDENASYSSLVDSSGF